MNSTLIIATGFSPWLKSEDECWASAQKKDLLNVAKAIILHSFLPRAKARGN